MADTKRHLAFCPHCGNTAPQRVALRHSYYTIWYGSDGQPGDDEGPECEAILCICETCGDVLLYSGISASETGTWPDLSYPQGPQLHKSVPDRIRAVYEEASRIKRQAADRAGVAVLVVRVSVVRPPGR